jgi:hypothetical protein
MGVYLVTWRLVGEAAEREADRAALAERLEAFDYVHYEGFETAYFISTDLRAGEINEGLRAALDPHDLTIVAQVQEGTYCGRLPQPVWDWIEERLDGPGRDD